MFVKITAFLSIFQVIFVAGSTDGYNSTDGEILAANVYDDIALKNIQTRLDLLQTLNENLRLKIDSLEMILNQQLTIQRNELKKDMDELKAALLSQKEPIKPVDSGKVNDPENCKYSNENLIDIRSELTKENQNNDISKPATTMQSLPKSCAEALLKKGRDGIYKIKLSDSGIESFYVYCLKDTTIADIGNYTSAWLVIQRRQDGSIDFHRNWYDYQHGFGNLEGEFFIGLDKLHALTHSTLHELWIQMEDFEGNKRWAKYSSFAIGAESDKYALNILGAYSGDAADSLSPHIGMKWTTLDVDNDKHPTGNCAVLYNGAWWHNSCHESNLNGQYLRGTYPQEQYGKGVDWYKWHGHNYSLKYVHMAIRPHP